ncbi:MAG: ParB/RepB/Spo0J family partition protein [Chloroflexota bacterium]|nr:ParB/RepB/Spo0J family partition protein [Chloroflexota bacterium]
MPRPDFRSQAAQRLSEERELSPQIISLLSPDPHGKGHTSVRTVPLERIDPNPQQPRMTFDEDTLRELAASITEHGVLQPILIRPGEEGRYQLVAGERRWRAARIAGLREIPALIEEIDDDTALEISIIENLQREDLSPLDEALMYERMTTDHGYSLRRLAQKLGKDKGYIENRLRLADAPAEIKQLVSLRKDTLSHAYELLKVEDPKKRRKLAEQVGRGELSLVKLRERIDGRPPRQSETGVDIAAPVFEDEPEPGDVAVTDAPVADDSLIAAKAHLGEALDELSAILQSQAALSDIDATDRQNLAKYLTIAKLRLENAITQVRLMESRP